MFTKREGTEVVSQCHVGRGAHPVDCHHLARRLDDNQVLGLEDMFDLQVLYVVWRSLVYLEDGPLARPAFYTILRA